MNVYRNLWHLLSAMEVTSTTNGGRWSRFLDWVGQRAYPENWEEVEWEPDWKELCGSFQDEAVAWAREVSRLRAENSRLSASLYRVNESMRLMKGK